MYILRGPFLNFSLGGKEVQTAAKKELNSGECRQWHDKQVTSKGRQKQAKRIAPLERLSAEGALSSTLRPGYKGHECKVIPLYKANWFSGQFLVVLNDFFVC